MAERKVLHDSVAPLPTGPPPGDLSQRRKLHFALRAPAERQAELEALVARGEVVAPTALAATYGVAEAPLTRLTDWLTAHGYTVEKVSRDRTSVYASAPLFVIAKSLGVEFVTVTKAGRTHTAARNAPSLPADIAADVRAIVGLQPHRHARKHAAPAAPPPARPDGYLVSDVLGAYGARPLQATGAGQVIAVLIDTVPDDEDLKAFWRANGQPEDLARVTKINVAGGVLPPPEGEETLDAQWASGIAPGATVRVYAAGTLSSVAIEHALDRIIEDLASQPGMRQLSVSFGLAESSFGAAQGEVAAQHDKFLRLAAAGVNVFVASGDTGQVDYQASDPCVVAVGGTTLRLNGDGTVAGETAWSSSGGGKSALFPRPPWQQGATVPAGSERLVPDVSLVADPDTGGLSVLYGSSRPIGGTSWATPVWAAFCALLNEARTQAGRPALGYLNPLLYTLAGSPAFRDVTTGSNGAYTAGPGYDLVTGLGTPDLGALLSALP